jgi:hypothetical protein
MILAPAAAAKNIKNAALPELDSVSAIATGGRRPVRFPLFFRNGIE